MDTPPMLRRLSGLSCATIFPTLLSTGTILAMVRTPLVPNLLSITNAEDEANSRYHRSMGRSQRLLVFHNRCPAPSIGRRQQLRQLLGYHLLLLRLPSTPNSLFSAILLDGLLHPRQLRQ